MDSFDVCNGDADGLCSLHQLRLVAPSDATLITGVKRDIALLQRVPLDGVGTVTVLDISLDRNRSALVNLLDAGAQVLYFDHHQAGNIPSHAALEAHIDLAADVCTSSLVDRYLKGAQRIWAVVGAFGDNMDDTALRLAKSVALDQPQIAALRDLGQCLNYNAYGQCEQDLFVAPALLYQQLKNYSDPFQFIANSSDLLEIRAGRNADLAMAQRHEPAKHCSGGQVFVLPDASWSRRVQGTFANALAQRAPTLAHAVLVADQAGAYRVSVRAPMREPRGADRLCTAFSSGGGRQSAAGIDHLPPLKLPKFMAMFAEIFDGVV